MNLLQMYDGNAVVAIHWTELKLLVEVLDGADPKDVKKLEHLTTLSTAFEAMMYAGSLQVEVGDVTLREFRAEQGLRDWQPSFVINDADDEPNEGMTA